MPHGFNLRFAVIMTLYGAAVLLVYRDEILRPVLAPLVTGTAHITMVLVHAIGIDAVREGAVLAHPHGFAYKVDYTCTGFLPIATFIACVLACSGKGRNKCVGIALGVPLWWVLNLSRLVHLFYLGVYVPEQFAMAHEVVWQVLQGVAFISMWLGWIHWSKKRVSPAAARSSAPSLNFAANLRE